jgi:hypothetical protein
VSDCSVCTYGEKMNLASKSSLRGRITVQIDCALDLTTFICGGKLVFEEIIDQMKRLYQGIDFFPTKKNIWDIRNASISSLTLDQLYHIASVFKFVVEGGKTAIVAPQDINYDILKIFEAEAADIARDFIVFRQMDDAISWLEK